MVAAQNGAVVADIGLFATLGDTLVSKIFTAVAAILLLVVVRRITNQQVPTIPR